MGGKRNGYAPSEYAALTRETVTTAYQDFYAGRCTAIK